VDLAADDEALEGFLDEEDGQLLLLAGLGEDGEEVGHRRRGDPGLLAVDDIAAVDLLRRGGDGVEVGAGVRLGHADGADLLAAQGRLEQALEDVGVAEHVQELAAHQRLHGHRAGERHRAAGDLGKRQGELCEREAGAADVLGVAHAEEAEVGELLEEGAREGARLVQRRRLRRDALVAEAREGVADLFLFVGEIEVHLSFPEGVACPGCRVSDSLHVLRVGLRPTLLLYFRESDTRHPGPDTSALSNRKTAQACPDRDGGVFCGAK
jgi:hypothetical protein